MAFDTAADVLNDAAVELGLVEETDPFASTDEAMLRLCRLLKSVGRRLVRAHHWSKLATSATFTLSTLTATYAAASDFDRLVDGTLWNRTRLRPVPVLSPSGWQEAQAYGWTTDPACRLFGTNFIFYQNPTAADVLYYEYISTKWVLDVSSVGQTEPSVSTDTLLFDPALLVCGLKLYFQRAKGFSTANEQADYDEALEAAIGADGAVDSVPLSPGSGSFQFRVNLPDTGWGL